MKEAKSTNLIVSIECGLIALLLAGLLYGILQIREHVWSFAAAYLMLIVMSATVVHRVLVRKFDWFEPVNFFFLAMGIGFAFRNIYIALGQYDYSIGMHNPEDFVRYLNLASWLGLLGVILFLLGYSLTAYAERIAFFIPVFRPRIRMKALYLVVIVYSIVGVFGLVMLIRESGFSLARIALANISEKRFYIESGHYVWALPQLLTTALLLISIVHFTKKRTYWFWVLFILACIWPFFSSMRGSLFSIWLMLLVAYRHFVKRVPAKAIAGVALIVFVSSSALLILRGLDNKTSSRESVASVGTKALSTFVDDMLGGASLADIVAFAHVLWAVPDSHDLKHGSTYLSLLARPIPREWYRDKPVNLGNWVAIDLYGRPYSYDQRGAIVVGGIPPPMIAELYWNFHLAGIIPGMFLFGILCRILYEYVRANEKNAYVVVLYSLAVVFVLKFTMTDFSNIATSLILQMLMLLVPIYVISGGLVKRGGGRQPIKTRKGLGQPWVHRS